MIRIKTGVFYAQAANCYFCLHIGSWAIFWMKPKRRMGYRLEVLTHYRRWRWSRGAKQTRNEGAAS